MKKETEVVNDYINNSKQNYCTLFNNKDFLNVV